MEQPVEDRARQHGVPERLAPFCQGLVRRDDGRRALVSPGDQPEEQVAALRVEGQEADLVDDEEPVSAEILEPLLEAVLHPRPLELEHQVRAGDEVRRHPLLRRRDPDRRGQVGLPDAGRADEDDVLGLLEEAEVGQVLHLPLANRRLEREVEVRHLLPEGEVRLPDASGGRPLPLRPDLDLAQLVEGVDRALLPARGHREVFRYRPRGLAHPQLLEAVLELREAVLHVTSPPIRRAA